MGDTLTHLPSREMVGRLLSDVAEALVPGGVFIATLRDYSGPGPRGTARFISVRSDERRILTCFLEYGEETVTVHDLVHERTDSGWALRVSSYPKLRLDPARLAEGLRGAGLVVEQDRLPNGMSRIIARRP
jgi:hypothetical protein